MWKEYRSIVCPDIRFLDSLRRLESDVTGAPAAEFDMDEYKVAQLMTFVPGVKIDDARKTLNTAKGDVQMAAATLWESK